MTSYKNDKNRGSDYLDPTSDELHTIHMSQRDNPDDVEAHAEPLRVVLADDDYIFVEGVAALLREWEEFELVGKAFTLQDAYDLCIQKNPATVMMGATFKGVGCAETVAKLCKKNPQIRIMIVASMGESGFVLDALRAGARGFGSRDEMTTDRLRALFWAQACGDIAFSGSLGTALQGALLNDGQRDRPESVESGVFDSLDHREKQILALLEEGLSNEEIGKQLYLSVPTVKRSIASIIQKLHVENRIQAAVLSARHGF